MTTTSQMQSHCHSKGKKLLFSFVLLIGLIFFYNPASSQNIPLVASGDQNYVSIWIPRLPIQTAASLKAFEGQNDKINISFKYINGLSQTIQLVDKSASVTSKDLISPFEYDLQGRQVKTYLPYTIASGGSGSCRVNATSIDQLAFYTNGNNQVAQSTTPFASIRIESSPLERNLEKGSVGNAWQLSTSGVSNSGHTLKFEYSENNEITLSELATMRLAVMFSVDIDNFGVRKLAHDIGGTKIYHDENTLFVKVQKNENWKVADGRSGTQETYFDHDDRVLLQRSFVKNTNGDIDILSTYYVYDELGNLSFVLPPALDPDHATATTGDVISINNLNKYAYQYSYDSRQRMVAKKIPGKDWEYFVFNKLDQIVASQNGNQRLKKEWLIQKYDQFGRSIISATWNNGNADISRENLQLIIDQQTEFYETRSSAGNGYSNLAWPQNVLKFYTINYYDDYNIPGFPSSFSYQSYAGNPGGYSGLVYGKLTASKTWMLSNAITELWSVNYYDENGRIIQNQVNNHLAGKDIYNSEYSFVNEVTKSVRSHTNSGGTINIVNRMEYDHHGRETKLYSQIGSAPDVLLRQTEYNEIGQMIDKKLHMKSGASKFIQSVDYRYNIRGWLRSINDASLAITSNFNDDNSTTSDADKFGQILKYEDAAVPQYNHTIGSIEWQNAIPTGYVVQSPVLKYDFRYDQLNRLTEAVSSLGNAKGKYFDEYLNYDKQGNIITLGRWAKLNSGQTQIDSLNYSYNGNQLASIDDHTNNGLGFSEGVGGAAIHLAAEYTYDADGNSIQDLNKGISLITYNNFDLPSTISFIDGRTITYEYDCTGAKLKRTLTDGSVYLTDYIDGIQYEQSSLAFISTPEGLAKPVALTGNYNYQYVIRDQVGNARVILQPSGPNETSAEIVQLQSYYPFGLEISSDEAGTMYGFVSGDKNDHLFNGKELQDASEYYDFGARFYDPKIGRWNAPDPANQLMDESPYAALANNPVYQVDPDGRVLPLVAAGVGALIGGVFNVATHWKQINGDWKKGLTAFGIGAAAGGLAGATMGASLAVTAGTTGLIALGNVVAIGAAAATVESSVRGIGNAIAFGDPYGPMDMLTDAFYGGITAGVGHGVENWVSSWIQKGIVPRVTAGPIAPGDYLGGKVASNTYRYMSDAELQAIKDTDYLRGGLAGETYFTKDVFKSAVKAQSRLSLGTLPTVRVEFQILNNPTFLLNGTKVIPANNMIGLGSEFMTIDPVKVRIINWQSLR